MKKLQIYITIETDDQHDKKDELKNIETRMANTAFYLMNVFGLLKSAARNSESYRENSEKFCEQVGYLSDIGAGLAYSIWNETSGLEDYRLTQNPPQAIDQIAAKLSYLATASEVPPPIKDGIEQILNDFFNDHISQESINDKTLTPEYIREMLENSDYFEVGGEAK